VVRAKIVLCEGIPAAFASALDHCKSSHDLSCILLFLTRPGGPSAAARSSSFERVALICGQMAGRRKIPSVVAFALYHSNSVRECVVCPSLSNAAWLILRCGSVAIGLPLGPALVPILVPITVPILVLVIRLCWTRDHEDGSGESLVSLHCERTVSYVLTLVQSMTVCEEVWMLLTFQASQSQSSRLEVFGMVTIARTVFQREGVCVFEPTHHFEIARQSEENYQTVGSLGGRRPRSTKVRLPTSVPCIVVFSSSRADHIAQLLRRGLPFVRDLLAELPITSAVANLPVCV